MSIASKFKSFCQNIRINQNVVDDISYRYGRITKQLNIDFWDTESSINHSLYVGSYGRDTDIHASDIDLLMRLPWGMREKYDDYISNGQSALLQAVRDSLKNTYSTSHIKGDGQVVQINFDDDVSFEIVPGFLYTDGSYSFPDTNDGGSWKITNPKSEIRAIRTINNECNVNLKNLCRMARSWKDQWNVPIGGLLIDTLACNFLINWKNKDKSYLYYDYMTRDFFEYLKDQSEDQEYWLAPGSKQYVWRKGNFEYKALRCYNLSLEAIDYEERKMTYSADEKWREIYGPKFKGE